MHLMSVLTVFSHLFFFEFMIGINHSGADKRDNSALATKCCVMTQGLRIAILGFGYMYTNIQM